MKKIFGIILAMLMVFSMSTAAFAGFTSAPKADETEPETVSVTVTLKDYTSAEADPVIFEQYFNYAAEKEEEKTVTVEGRIFTVAFAIKNDTKEIIYADDVLEGFGLSITNSTTEKTVERWTKAKDNGFGETDLSKIAINPGKDSVVNYKIYAITDSLVTIKAIYEEEAKDIEKNATFTLVAEVAPPTTTVPPTETTTSTTVAPIETTTTTTAPIVDEETNDYEEPSDEYEAPEVDYEIPNTGSSKAIGGVVALGVIAAGALLLVKKRKSNEEDWA